MARVKDLYGIAWESKLAGEAPHRDNDNNHVEHSGSQAYTGSVLTNTNGLVATEFCKQQDGASE